MGGIYTLGISPGTTERYNHIHHVYNYAPVSHGSGIYPDEGSSEILIENNVVYRVRDLPAVPALRQGQHRPEQHPRLRGQGSAAAMPRGHALPLHRRRQHRLCRHPEDARRRLEKRRLEARAQPLLEHRRRAEVRGDGFRRLAEKGHDDGSIVADPLFVDPANGDFRLQAGLARA